MKQNEKIRKIRVPKLVRKASKLYADQVSKHILSWAKDDMYDQTRTFPKYTIQEDKLQKLSALLDIIEDDPEWAERLQTQLAFNKLRNSI